MSNCNYNTEFKEVNKITDDFLLNILESNFKMYLDWSLLKIGSWFDARINQSGLYGSNLHSNLVYVDDGAYDDGAVWQSIRKDWVWESGIVYASGSPISVSGLYINNSYIPYSSGTFEIDYAGGKVMFDTAINTNSSVKLNYSYRYIQTHRALDNPWFDVLQFNSYQTDNPDITRNDNGEWSISSNMRVQMPCIIIESVPKSRSRPYELGNRNLVIEQDIAFHILAENKNDRNKIMDILRLQQDNNIMLFDTNKLSTDDNFPLQYNGNLKNNPLMYPNIVDQYAWRKCWIKNATLFEINSPTPDLHRGMVRYTLEIISS
jgi:hypothetical protein